MVLPESLLRRYEEKCYFYSTTVSRIDQKILDEFIREGYYERYLNKMRKYYREKHDYMLECLKPFQDTFQITGENAGLHLVFTSKKNIPEETLLASAATVGVKVYGLSESLVGDKKTNAPATIILGYGGLEKKQIKEGMEALKKAWLS